MDRRLARLQRELSSAIAEFSAAQLVWHEPEKWCAAEILEHLYLTYTGTAKGFSRVLEADKPLASALTLKNRGQSFVVLRLGYMPTGRKSPDRAKPRGLPAGEVLSKIGPAMTDLDEVMLRCAARFGGRTKLLDHPNLGPLSVNQWRKFHLVHGLHHVKQLHRLRAMLATQNSTTLSRKKESAGR